MATLLLSRNYMFQCLANIFKTFWPNSFKFGMKVGKVFAHQLEESIRSKLLELVAMETVYFAQKSSKKPSICSHLKTYWPNLFKFGLDMYIGEGHNIAKSI